MSRTLQRIAIATGTSRWAA